MKLIHTWSYRDEQKNVVGLVKRFEVAGENGEIKKIVLPFFVREGEEWKKGGAQKPRPLYNLPGIHGAETIIVTEGEKCAEALAQLGLPATTSCGGANGTKDANWSVCKCAKKIVLMPDADEPGETYIREAAQCIAAAHPEAAFFVLRIPGFDNGQDIVDWLQERAQGWDGYRAFSETEREKLLPAVRELFKNRAAYSLPAAAPKQETKKSTPPAQDNGAHVAEVRAALSFEAILSRYGHSTQGATRQNGCTRICSPFSNDSNPSFDFNESEKWFNCFSSGKKGDVFGLIAEFERCDTKGDGWKKVMEVAESITGLVKPKQERKSNVTSITTRLPLNLSSIAHDLLSIPAEGLSPEDALVACEPVLRAIAASDGVQDEIVFGHIKDHFKLKAAFLAPFKKTVTKYRKELKETGQIEKPERDGDSEKPIDAPRSLYLQLFPQFLGEIRRDIFSGDSLYWDASEKVYSPVLNEMKLLKSRFLKYGEEHNIRFFMSAVDYHFEEFHNGLEPRLVVDVPEWDGRDYLKELCDRVTLAEVVIPEVGAIDNLVLEEFIKEWHAKMWEKLSNPHVQNRIIVLKGDQGIGKDYWQLEQLGGLGQFVVPMTVEDSNKDTKAQLHQGLAVTISEFDRTVKQHTSTMKELLTAATTMIRLPYDARAKPRFVRCSFMASCNVDEVLRDYTGNRRYVLFALSDIDRTKQFTEREKLQVLAQGKALAKMKYRASEQSERVMAAYIRQETPKSPTQALLEEWDDAAHLHYLTKLDVDAKNEVTKPATRGDAPKGAFGFMPNRMIQEDQLLGKLSKRFGWNERYLVGLLDKAGRRDRMRVGPHIDRGFWWCSKEASPVTPVTEGVTDDEIDFL